MQVTRQNPKKKYNYWAGWIAVLSLLKDDRPLPRRCGFLYTTQRADRDAGCSVNIRYGGLSAWFNHISGSCWLKQ